MSADATHQPAADVARELLDEVREQLRIRDGWVDRSRETALKLEAARGFLELAWVESDAADRAARDRIRELHLAELNRGTLNQPEPGWVKRAARGEGEAP